MGKSKNMFDQIKIMLVIGLMTLVTGCASYGGGGYYGDAVVVSEPDEYLFGGGYDRGRDVNNHSHRGFVSRGAAHSGGSHIAAHSSGANRGRR